jgi:excisionase family DNA binding protein
MVEVVHAAGSPPAPGSRPPHPEGLLTIRQVAGWLNVTPKTVWQMVRDGRLEAPLKINERGNIRFRAGALQRFEERCAEVEYAKK